VISGNHSTGIAFSVGNGGAISTSIIAGNFIGTDATGISAIANTQAGIDMGVTSGNTIGGTTAAARNIISGNGTVGINVSGGGAGQNSDSNSILGNYIGVNANGAALGNTGHGINLGTSTGTVTNTKIGDPSQGAGAANVIAKNGQMGLLINT